MMKIIIPSMLLMSNSFISIQSAPVENGARINTNHPLDVGLVHAHIIHDLQERMEDSPPGSHLEYLHAVSQEMRSNLCDAKDPVCNSRIVQKTINMQTGPKNGHTDGLEYVKSIVPDIFDPKVMDYMDKLFFTMSLSEIDMEHTNQVLTVMKHDLDSMLQDKEIKHERSREVGMIAYSVAMESTKQWTEILTDESNPFNRALTSIAPDKYHERKLQFDQPDNTAVTQENSGFIDPALEEAFLSLLEADLLGATEGAIEAFFATGNNTLVAQAVEEATMASLKAVVALFLVDAISGQSTGIGGGDGFGPGACDFPDAFWCNPTVDNMPDAETINTILGNVLPPVPPGGLPPPPGANGNGNPVPPGQGPGFPNNSGTGNPPVTPAFPFDPCSIPNNNPFCPGNVNSVNQEVPTIPPPNTDDDRPDPPTTTTTPSGPTDPAIPINDDDCLFPNQPSLCVEGGNNIPVALPEEPPIDPESVCITFPNLPICQNGGTLPAPDQNRPPPPFPFLGQQQQQQTQTQPQQAPASP